MSAAVLLLLLYVVLLHQALQTLEAQSVWAAVDGEKWTRFLSRTAPVMESSTSVSKLIEALWPHFMSERIKGQILTVLNAALAEIPERCPIYTPRNCNTGIIIPSHLLHQQWQVCAPASGSRGAPLVGQALCPMWAEPTSEPDATETCPRCRYNARIRTVQLGSAAPVIHNVTTALNPDGSLCALDCQLHYNCSDMMVNVEASTPLGTGKLKVRIYLLWFA